ncbi:MAG: Gfo/Idh/MocA family oxidoreductase [Acidimicrobiales bacterium]
MDRKLKVGVIGAGVIAQVMHLHFLRELNDRFETVALCDLSNEVASACAREYGIPAVFTDWRAMLGEDLDAVLILTSGSHAPVAVEAARAGKHVFSEKPMCFSAVEGAEMIEAARVANVVLMVGYPKRYDPAFTKFVDEAAALSEHKLLRVTTTESPFEPYVAHYPLIGPPADVDKELLAILRADSESRLESAIGTNDPFLVRQYQAVLLDTLVHEVNTARAVLGEPTSLDYVDLREGHATVALDFGGPTCVIHWLETPDMTRYAMEFSLHAANGRATLTFPSPYLRNAPTALVVERGGAGIDSWRREEITSYESGFKEELRVFYDAVTDNRSVPTDGVDANHDIALCQAIIRSFVDRAPVANPTEL